MKRDLSFSPSVVKKQIQYCNAHIKETHMNVEVLIFNSWYVGKLRNCSDISLQAIENIIREEEFQIKNICRNSIEIFHPQFSNMTLYNSTIKDWIQIGNLKDLEGLMKIYQKETYTFGITYNTVHPMDIIVSNWNRGWRVTIIQTYPQGDNGKQMKRGTAMWTKGTDDIESKQEWYHRYVYFDFGEKGSNKYNNPKLFVRFN